MKKLAATFVSLFPESIEAFVRQSILGRAIKAGILGVNQVQIRDHALDKHKTVDDTPYGGGPGQLMRVDVVVRAIRAAQDGDENARVILVDPAAPLFTQSDAKRLASYNKLVFVCGRYEGIDARVYHYVDEAFSIGDYVITGGELASLVLFDAIARQVPGVLGNEASGNDESHQDGLLEYSQYTRPQEFEGHEVPEVFANGNHQKIKEARRTEQLLRTKLLRPDLFAKLEPTRQSAPDQPGFYPWQRRRIS